MKSFNFSGLRALALVSLLFITIAVATSALIFLEYVFGNADGIWWDILLMDMAFKLVTGVAFCTVVFYLLFFSHKVVRSLSATILLTALLLIAVDFLCKRIISWRSAPAAVKSAESPSPFLRPDWTDSFVFSDTLGVRAKRGWHLKWTPVKDGVVYV